MELFISSQILDGILDSSSGTAHIKDACTKKYIRSNSENLMVYGFNCESDIIGATIHDLGQVMQSNWDKEFTNTVDQLDNKVIYTKQVYYDNSRAFLNKTGYLRVQDMTKYPVINSNNTVTAVLTICKDRVNQLSLNQLYEIYVQFYKNNFKLAIANFLHHTGIEKYFHEHPTDAETKVLIAKKSYHSHKHLAGALGRSVKTIDIHLSNLNAKIQSLDLTRVAAAMGVKNVY